ncbi:hypothetical protein BGZ58_002251, partial [Dissophora ornata]
HPRWVTLGCIVFSAMLSCTIYMTKSWQPHEDTLEFEREWQWPEMDPWKTVMMAHDFDSDIETNDILLSSFNGSATRLAMPPTETEGGKGDKDILESNVMDSVMRLGSEVKTWDISDPTLSLGSFFNSDAWKNQTLVPASDFVNLLRVLRPIDQAFFITLFVNQLPLQMAAAHYNGQGRPPKVSSTEAPSWARSHHSCGPWIPDYVQLQNRMLDKTLPSRYTIHTCPRLSYPDKVRQPCGDIFSQMLAMVSAFAWSVTESRGFFINPDQVEDLQESFDQSLIQHRTSPPKTDRAAQINTEDMTSRDLDRLFRLHDPLFSSHVNDDNNNINNQYPTKSYELANSIGSDDDEDEQLADDEMQRRLWGLRSKSRNRVSFERKLMPYDPAPSFVMSDYSKRLSGQRRLGQRTASSRMKKLINGLKQDGVELILNQDLLPQFVNTTRTLRLFLELGLPVPNHIVQLNQEQLGLQNGMASSRSNSQSAPGFVRGGGAPTIHAPSAHGPISALSHASSLSSTVVSQESISVAFHTAIHDERDMSRIQAVPKTFGCLLDVLIQPKLELLQLIHPYATLFKLPAIFSVGIYIRPMQGVAESEQDVGERGRARKSQKSISKDREVIVNRYLTCARQIAQGFAPKRKGQKIVYVVVSEDTVIPRVMESQEEWDEEVIIPKWVIPKERPQQQPRHQSSQISKQQQAVLENWVLSKTDFQVVSDQSDFAKVAVWRTRREGRSIVIRESSAVEKEKKEKGYVDMLDCGTLLKNLIVT